MLRTPGRKGGFSLIELVVVLALMAFLLVMTVRAFGGWAADGRVRTTAESLLNALRVAQANAIAHNRIAAFVLTADAPARDAKPSASGGNWFAKLVPLAGSDETDAGLGMIQGATIARQYGVKLVATSANGSVGSPLCFNSLGQLVAAGATAIGLASACSPPTDGSPVAFTVSNDAAVRQLKVLVYPGGQMRLCDAAKVLSNANPDGCP